jgi:hypothetical protein
MVREVSFRESGKQYAFAGIGLFCCRVITLGNATELYLGLLSRFISCEHAMLPNSHPAAAEKLRLPAKSNLPASRHLGAVLPRHDRRIAAPGAGGGRVSRSADSNVGRSGVAVARRRFEFQRNCPGIALPVGGFVAEGSAIPVQTAPTNAGAILTPHKLATITTLSNEMMRNANAETLVRQVLIESTGPSIDKVLFGTNPASANGPAGLLNGVTALTPTAGGEKSQIIIDNLQAIAVAPVAANGEIVLVGSPDVAVALRLRLYQGVEWPVLASAALAPKTVIAIAARAVVSAVEGAPEIDAAQEAELHRETQPTEIVTSAGTIAMPVGSIFQRDETALRLRWPISWALRSSTAVAWMTGVNW